MTDSELALHGLLAVREERGATKPIETCGLLLYHARSAEQATHAG